MVIRMGLSLLLSLMAAHAAAQASEPSARCQLPGAVSFGVELCESLEQARVEKRDDYPRSRHLGEDGTPRYLNRLSLETSPYLRQHAFNPVNWYPWGDEAFETARRLGRPILLSIGYSTCHWCHVMEEESFEDLEIAEFLNQHYIAIKVDREQRPDIDSIYMTAVQAMTGRGGWPMTTWLNADRQPFFGGTYFPARDGDRGSRVGFLTLLGRLNKTYLEHPDEVEERGRQLATTIRKRLESSHAPKAESWAFSNVDAVAERFQGLLDDAVGGVRGAPKFPATFPVRLLLRHAAVRGDEISLAAAIKTLDGMATGGLFDPIGGGFHRYTVDGAWRVPHFEKMLYDNAQLALAYLEGWQLTAEPRYRESVTATLDYLVREMQSPSGAFYAATDADSLTPDGELEEGRFFTWTPAEIDSLLPVGQRELAKSYFGIHAGGNLEGRSVPYRPVPLKDLAARVQRSESEIRVELESIRQRIYRARSKRHPPLRDDKLLTAWNGLTISAFAQAGFVLRREDYLGAARAAATNLLARPAKEGRLQRTADGGAAFLEDYSFFIAGLLDLFEATGEARWFAEAQRLQQLQDAEFDSGDGAYYRTPHGHERLLARQRPMVDGAIPSGNAIAVANLLRFAELTGKSRFRVHADRVVGGSNAMLMAVAFAAADPIEVVLVYRGKERSVVEPFLDALREIGLRPAVTVLVDESQRENRQRLEKLLPITDRKQSRKLGVTAYVCRAGLCKLPTSDVAAFRTLIEPSSMSPEPLKK